MTLELINQAAHVHFMVTGKEKARALRQCLEGPKAPHRFPAQGVHPRKGQLTWWADQAAGSGVKK